MKKVCNLYNFILDVPDFPKPGVGFKDITPLLANPSALSFAVELLSQPYRGDYIDIVVGTESRGFIFGTAVARDLSAGFVPIRKSKKLPREVLSVSYDLEYGHDTIEIHKDALKPNARVLIVDDVLATGGTMTACCELIKQAGAEIVGVAVLIELMFLSGRKKLSDWGLESGIYSILKFEEP